MIGNVFKIYSSGDFYDCLFLYFSCSDYEKPGFKGFLSTRNTLTTNVVLPNQYVVHTQSPGWPDNKEKCTNLFNYCITYVDKHNNTNKDADSNDPEEDDPFVVKVILGQLKTKIK